MDTGKCICLCICVVLQVITVESVRRILEMSGGTNCGSTYYIRDVDDDGFLISWVGQTINSGCELYIKAENEIKPCVALVTYVMPDCTPKISVYDGSQIDHNQMRYVNCYSRVLQMCGSNEGSITMKFADFTSVSSSNVTLKVYGETQKDDDNFNYHLIQPIATAAGVFLVIVATAIGWCVVLKISRKRERERKARMAANPPMSWAQQAQAAQTQAQYNQGYTYNTNQNTMYYPTATSNPVEKV